MSDEINIDILIDYSLATFRGAFDGVIFSIFQDIFNHLHWFVLGMVE